MKAKSLLMLMAVSMGAAAVEPLSERELSATTGGTIDPEIAYLDAQYNQIEWAANQQQLSEQQSLDTLFAIADLLLPWSQFLNYDREVVGVVYGDREPIQVGYGTSLQLPVYIERISYRNIRPAVGENNPTMGDVHVEGIRFSDDAYVIVSER